MNKSSPKKDALIYSLLLVLISISSISYIPEIYMNEGLYGKLHFVLLASMMGLTILTNNLFKLIENVFLNKIFFPLLIFSLLLILFYALGFRTTSEDFMQIAIVYVSVWIGHELKIKENGIVSLLIIYGIVAAILGYSSINTYTGELSLEGNMYDIEGKNQIGAIVSTGAFFMAYTAQTVASKKMRFISLLLAGILFVLLVIVRCRTALLAFIILTIFSTIKLNDRKNLTIYSIIGFILLIIFSQQILEILQDAFIGDRGTANMDDLSSNRIERNIQGMAYLSDNIFIGELKAHSGIEIIHNYLLNRLVLYGIWAIPLVFCYFVFAVRILKKTLLPRSFTFEDIGYFVLIIPFFCSLLEPDAPFGPGTVQAFLYIIFGYSSKNSLNR